MSSGPPVTERGPAQGLNTDVPLSASPTGSSRALSDGTQQSGSHSVRQWRQRRREDEQQVRRVSGAWPPLGPLSPNRPPGPLPPGPGAHSAEPLAPGPPRPEPSCARGPDGAGRARPRSPGPLSRWTPARHGPGEGRPRRPEGDFRTPRPGGCGLPAAWRGGTSALRVFPQPCCLLSERGFPPALALRPGKVTSPFRTSVLSSASGDGNRARVVELGSCDEVMGQPR